MPRFYIEAELAVDTQVELTETVFHHWVKVPNIPISLPSIDLN